MNVLPACIPVFHVHTISTHGGQKRASDPRTGVLASCKPPCGCWELNPDPWKPALLSAEPFL